MLGNNFVFLALLPVGSERLPLFRRIDRGSVRGQFFRKEGIGYSRMSECVKEALVAIGEDPSRYGLQSFRSGSATAVASQAGFDPRKLEKHGGWAPGSSSMPGYIEDDAEAALVVPLMPLHLSLCWCLCSRCISHLNFLSLITNNLRMSSIHRENLGTCSALPMLAYLTLACPRSTG